MPAEPLLLEVEVSPVEAPLDVDVESTVDEHPPMTPKRALVTSKQLARTTKYDCRDRIRTLLMLKFMEGFYRNWGRKTISLYAAPPRFEGLDREQATSLVISAIEVALRR
jgi:hypothetical protein